MGPHVQIWAEYMYRCFKHGIFNTVVNEADLPFSMPCPVLEELSGSMYKNCNLTSPMVGKA